MRNGRERTRKGKRGSKRWIRERETEVEGSDERKRGGIERV